MAGDWQGFSDRELKLLQQRSNKQPVDYPLQGGHHNSAKPASLGERSGRKPRPAVPQEAGPNRIGTSQSPTAHAQKRIPQPSVERSEVRERTSNVTAAATHEQLSVAVTNGPDSVVPDVDKPSDVTVPFTDQPSEKKIEREMDFSDCPPSNLETLQQRQKEIEAENRKKKALLEETLQDRYRKSQLEAKTLLMVKAELDRVEGLVTRDVALLRDRIEEVSREYNYARKRYEQAEAEFISSKVELHRTAELKELLSEHLCTVIQQNEVRKANKLAELLQALSIEANPGSQVVQDPSAALFHKTPTPGMDIWPKGSQDKKSMASKDKGRTGPVTGSDEVSTEVHRPTAIDSGLEVPQSNTTSTNAEQPQPAVTLADNGHIVQLPAASCSKGAGDMTHLQHDAASGTDGCKQPLSDSLLDEMQQSGPASNNEVHSSTIASQQQVTDAGQQSSSDVSRREPGVVPLHRDSHEISSAVTGPPAEMTLTDKVCSSPLQAAKSDSPNSSSGLSKMSYGTFVPDASIGVAIGEEKNFSSAEDGSPSALYSSTWSTLSVQRDPHT